MKIFLISTIFCTILMLCPGVSAQSVKPDTLNGIIEEKEVDSDGLVVSVIFNVLDEDFNTQSYNVENNSKGRELFEYIGQNIDVIGIIKNNSDGSNSITVMEYFIPEDDDYSLPDDIDEDE